MIEENNKKNNHETIPVTDPNKPPKPEFEKNCDWCGTPIIMRMYINRHGDWTYGSYQKIRSNDFHDCKPGRAIKEYKAKLALLEHQLRELTPQKTIEESAKTEVKVETPIPNGFTIPYLTLQQKQLYHSEMAKFLQKPLSPASIKDRALYCKYCGHKWED